MAYPENRIAVTGLGLLTSLGGNAAETWAHLQAGRSGVKSLRRFSTAGLRTTIAAVVDRYADDERLSCSERTRLMLNDVVAEAVLQSGLGNAQLSQARVFIAVPGGEADWTDRRIAAQCDGDRAAAAKQRLYRDGLTGTRFADLQHHFGFRVPPAVVTTACASGATAVQLCVDAIRRGETDLAIAAAADSTVSPEGLVRFSLLSALSRRNDQPTTASRPFDRDRDGFVMGEGGAALVLESEAFSRRRGARVLGFVRGCGDATDNFHRTRSNPTGERIRMCIERALTDAQIEPQMVSAVNAHGTSTPENDKMEALGLRLALGDAAAKVLVSSNKSMIGHTLSAAGLIEAAISLLSLTHQIFPPSINVDHIDETLGLNVVTQATAAPLRFILSNSFGFGGQNVSLVLERAEAGS